MLTPNHSAIDSVVYKNFNKKSGTIRAKRYVLACGGIENAKNLLASNTQLPGGVGKKPSRASAYRKALLY
jgi:hypothetical protein